MNISFRPGELLGRYTVVAPIGAGGMGEVYKAVDPTLDRTVALKILPPELVRNDERVRRFVQEAKSASSLTHPHIVTIYEIGTASLVKDIESADGKPIHYIAMELVDGPTLKHLIHQERTELRTLVRYLAQAAEGLAKAHAAGIVHRDLKPENIVVSKDRFAKVLDFGLAKLTERTEAADVSGSRTAVREQTRDGIVVGTVGYMSPEQVQARPVDHRSDIFSFGCILYEAATRHKPFVADSDVEVMHKIVHDKPEPLDDIVPAVPGELRRIIRRCLAKEPEKRFQSMKDLAIDLAEIDEQWNELSTSSVSGSGSSAAASVPPRMSRRAAIASVAVVILVLAAAAVGIYRWARMRPVPQKPDVFSSMKIAPATASGDLRNAAISADGKYLAHVRTSGQGSRIVIRQIATGSDAVVVPQVPEPIVGLTFSPDGNYVYYVEREPASTGYSTLYQVPTLGGRPKKLVFDIDCTPGFSPDGKHIAFVRGNPPAGESYLMVANADGSSPRKLVSLKNPERFNTIAAPWSPDGKTIVVWVQDDRTGLTESIEAIDAGSGARRPALRRRFVAPTALTWLSDGSGLVFSAADLSPAQPAQLWLLSWPDGALRRITNDLAQYSVASVTADSKVLAAMQSRSSSVLWRQGKNETEPRQVSNGSGQLGMLSASSQALYFVVPTMSGVSIWTAAPDGSDMRALINDDAVNYDPAVPADGRFMLYASLRGSSGSSIWRVDRDGSEPRRLATDATLISNHVMDVAPNGEWFVYSQGDGHNLVKVPMDGGKPVELVHERFAGATRISPDNQSIFGFVWEEGTAGRAGRILHLSGGTPTRLEIRGRDYRFAPDSKSLTYVRDTEGVSNLWRQPFDGGPSTQVTHFKSGVIASYTWAPDGSLILSRGEAMRDAVLITDFR